MNCKICSKKTNFIFERPVLNKYQVKYFFCDSCKFIQTENPYWLDESYQNPIASIDTGIIKRNLLVIKRTSVIIYFLFNHKNMFLDYGGGIGIFVRMMRDIGFDFYWYDKFSENILARGFESQNVQSKFELVTSFECFEHFVNPIMEIEEMIKKSDNILFSTQLFNSVPPNPDDWWYYNFEAGQHISLYSLQALKIIANKLNLYLCSDKKGFHMLSKKKRKNSVFKVLSKLSLVGLFNVIKLVTNSKSESDMYILKSAIAMKENI